MIDHTDLELRFAAHEARVGRVNRDGWTRQVSVSGGDTHQQETAGSARMMLGSALGRVRTWLHGTASSDPSNPMAVRHIR
jgi:hypothetical protein